MPKHTRIYTRTGDDGTTGLVGGQRVLKNSQRIETFGTLDELSSAIGLVRTELMLHRFERGVRLDAWLAWIQDLLFNIGSQLATLPKDHHPAMPTAQQSDVDALERAIDEAEVDLVPLANFIHPGGSRPGAMLHLARTICRRAERLMLVITQEDESILLSMRWINRLSDALFVWARWINADLQLPEHRWNPKTAPPV